VRKVQSKSQRTCLENAGTCFHLALKGLIIIDTCHASIISIEYLNSFKLFYV